MSRPKTGNSFQVFRVPLFPKIRLGLIASVKTTSTPGPFPAESLIDVALSLLRQRAGWVPSADIRAALGRDCGYSLDSLLRSSLRAGLIVVRWTQYTPLPCLESHPIGTDRPRQRMRKEFCLVEFARPTHTYLNPFDVMRPTETETS